MFVKKFLERKPVRTAVKKWVKGDKKTTRTAIYSDMDTFINSNQTNRVCFLIFDTISAKPQIYEYDEETLWEEVPEELENKYKCYKMEEWNETNFSIKSSSYVTESTIFGEVVDIMRQTNGGTIEQGVGNMTFLKRMKAIPSYMASRLRILFRYLYYDRAHDYSTEHEGDYQFFWLQNDIIWINSNLGGVAYWSELGAKQFPGWYDTLTDNQKKSFPREMSYSEPVDAYKLDVGEVLTLNAINNLITLKTGGSDDFIKQYKLLLNMIYAELLCIHIDHKMFFWYRPYTEGLECTSEHAFWCDPDAILVKYSNVPAIPFRKLLEKIALGEITENLTNCHIDYIHMSMSDLCGSSTSLSEWEEKLKEFWTTVETYLTLDGNIEVIDPQKIMNLTYTDLYYMYDTLHDKSSTGAYRGFLTYVEDVLATTYDKPWEETGGLLVANGVLAPKWQYISDAFKAIVDKDENGYVFYKNIDFETLLASEYPKPAITSAIWKPWKCLQQILKDEYVYSFIDMDFYKSYDLVPTSDGTCLYPVDTSGMSPEEQENYYVPVTNNRPGWYRKDIPKTIYQSYCTGYLEFYRKYEYFNAPELRSLFWEVLYYSLQPSPWYYSSDWSPLVALGGDLQIWKRFLDVDPTIPTDEESTKGPYTTVWEQIVNNYGHISDRTYGPLEPYWCAQKDSRENISHLEKWYKIAAPTEDSNESEIREWKLWRFCHQFIRVFGSHKDTYIHEYEFTGEFMSKFTADIRWAYQDVNPNSSDNMNINFVRKQTYAIVDKHYYDPTKYTIPDFEHWDWRQLFTTGIDVPSYMELPSYMTLPDPEGKQFFYTYKLCSVPDYYEIDTDASDWFIPIIELPLYTHEDLRIEWQEPNIDFTMAGAEYTEKEKTRIKQQYETWIQECNTIEKEYANKVHEQLAKMILSLETSYWTGRYTSNPDSDHEMIYSDDPTYGYTDDNKYITVYSVDCYLDEDIDRLLDNIFSIDTLKGVYAYDTAIYEYVDDHKTELENVYGGHIPDEKLYGRFHYDRGEGFYRNYDSGTNMEAKSDQIRLETTDENNVVTGIVYYTGIYGQVGNAEQRMERWGPFTTTSGDTTSYGGAFNGEYEKFYTYTKQLTVPQPSGVQVSAEMLDESEYEIYECDQIYETFVLYETSAEKVLKVTPTSGKANEYLDMIINIPAVKALLDKVYVPKPAPAEYTVSDVCLYKNPIYQTNIEKPNVVNTCAILEYGQFLATIQSRRNLIQQGGEGGDEVLVKFTQTERGTFFEILGKEPESSSADVYEGAVAGFFISKGYQGKVAEGQKTQKPTIPKGRYDRKVRRSVIPAKPVSAAPEPRGENGEEWRITIVPKFYEGEPLDWTKDNYYTTFLFAQNADNLNIQIDPEFEARNKVVFTPGTGDNQPERLEEQMIGYFVAVPKRDP